MGPDGFLEVCDTDAHMIRRIGRDGHVSTLSGRAGIGSEDGPAATARFDGPCGIAAMADGTLIIADHFNERIRRIGTDGTVTSLSPPRTPGIEFLFHGPNSVAVRPDGAIYVLERIAGRLSLLWPDQHADRIAGGGFPTYRDGHGTGAGFLEPSKLCLAPDGRVFLGDRGNHRIREVSQDGTVRTIAGGGPVGIGTGSFADGTGATARFHHPSGVVLTPSGDLLVADSDNHRIRRIRGPALPSP